MKLSRIFLLFCGIDILNRSIVDDGNKSFQMKYGPRNGKWQRTSLIITTTIIMSARNRNNQSIPSDDTDGRNLAWNSGSFQRIIHITLSNDEKII